MKKTILKLITVALLIPFACNPKEEIAPENPCKGQEEIKADFVIEEGGVYYGKPIFVPIDSVVFAIPPLRFRVTTPNIDSCRWFLGSEQIKEKVFTRGSFPSGTKIEVKLIVYKKYKLGCSRNFKESDTIYKHFYTYMFDSQLKNWTIYSTYRGYKKSNPTKLITVELGYTPNTEYNSIEGNFITNIPYNGYASKKYIVNKGGFNQDALSAFYGYNTIAQLSSNGIKPFLSNKLGSNNFIYKTKENIRISYDYFKDTLDNGFPNENSPLLYDEFNGIKIK